MKVLVIDGQGGNIGKMLVEQIRERSGDVDIIAVGTNSIATAAMMRAGACRGATGENAVVVNCRDADYIIGPIGILVADSLLGELTGNMALAIGQSRAQKVLIPVSRCHTLVVGVQTLPRTDYIRQAVDALFSAETG